MVASIAGARTIDEIPNVHIADSTRFVSDPDGYLSHEAIVRADAIIKDIWDKTTAEFVAIVVKDLSGEDIDSYAHRLSEKWGIGKSDKDNGLLLLISIDDRMAGIYTGYGVEGVITDVRAANVRRDYLNPSMKVGDYDAGVVNTLAEIHRIMTAPEAAEELRSGIPNNAAAGDDGEDLKEFFISFSLIGLVATIVMLFVIVQSYRSTSKENRHERYYKLQKINLPILIFTVGFIGIPIIAYLLLQYLKRRVRMAKIKCPNCQHEMQLIDEVHDNVYLTPAQDREEQLNSVDYDVWACNQCGNTEIYPYVNQNSPLTECPVCGAKTESLVANNMVRKPTTQSEGLGEKTYCCKNCQNRRKVPYTIAKLATPPVVIIPGGGGGFGSGGGGFGGGSFGGGSFGGGGSSGGW